MKNKYPKIDFFVPGLFLLLCIILKGCTIPPTPPAITSETALVRIAPGEFPLFEDDMNYDGLAHGILQSLEYMNRLPPDRAFSFGKDRFETPHMIKSLEFFLDFIRDNPSSMALRQFIADHYRVYGSVGSPSPGHVLFTGYYEPVLQGRRKPGPIYKIPVYGRPDDLVSIDLSKFSAEFKGKKLIGRYTGSTIVPYHDRQAIATGDILRQKSKPLVWIKDPIDLFFLQIQGSGKVILENGDALYLHYHITNGHSYRSIGKLLIKKNKISKDEMSMQKIREYLTGHPSEMREIFNYNPSYVFFKFEKKGPLGSLNVKLSPLRSIATDRRLFPKSALAFINTQKPLIDGNGKIKSWSAFSRFVLNQDTGGAIRGPGRADLFFGCTPDAEVGAGHMQHAGLLYFLILEPDKLSS
ncbi:MAG: MltA domain-containing protein [Deltaproteobacteria bacterium]|nr:MltA domain-containing protein [Deltaproteobacteria bacterium]